jgi:hypothetical protein
MQDNGSDAPPNLRPRVYHLIVIALLLTFVIIVLYLESPGDIPFYGTATWISEQNATFEQFRMQTQSPVIQTPVQ